jgi:DNA-binding transcriptional MerR regulator
MDNDFQTFEKALTSKDIAAMIGIAESTVRKYAAALEDAGYPFLKDGAGEKAARIFTESDAMVIRHLKELREKTNIPVEQAAQLVASKHPKGMTQTMSFNAMAEKTDYDTVISAVNERHEERYTLLEEKMDSLMELNKALLDRLDKRDAVIHELAETLNTQKAIAAAGEDRQEERDRKRDEQVMQILQEIREAKHLAGKSVWSRLFGK